MKSTNAFPACQIKLCLKYGNVKFQWFRESLLAQGGCKANKQCIINIAVFAFLPI